MSFPTALRSARERKELSQAELAKLMGVSPGTVANWESRGEHHHGIRMARLEKLASVLDCAVEDLLA